MKKPKKSIIKRSSNHKRVKLPVVAGIFGGWVLLALITGSVLLRVINPDRPVSINQGGIKLTVRNVSYDEHGKTPFAAPAGYKFAILDVSVQNNRSQSFWFSPVVQTYITDKSGEKFEMSPTFMLNPIVAGPLNPGGTRTGSISYLIPINSSDASLRFDSQK